MQLSRNKVRSHAACIAFVISTLFSSRAVGELYINEIFFDPPGAQGDNVEEYVELRGTPGMSLANHYLIFVENEDNATHTGSAGQIEMIFTFGDWATTPQVESPYMIGTNGYLTLRQKFNPYNAPTDGTTDLSNIGFGSGYGSGATSSSIRAEDLGNDGKTENSGFTAMLIRNDGDPVANRPTLGFDLDFGNDGLDHPNGKEGWEILDAIGVYGEEGEAGFGRTYAKITFGQEIPGQSLDPENGGVFDLDSGQYIFVPRIEPGTTYVGIGYEIELAARWGNSTGQTAADWHITNVTGSFGSGRQSEIDLRQSCIDVDGVVCHPDDDDDVTTPPPLGLPTESNYGVPYGMRLIDNLGQPNFMLGDYNGDGVVDAADYTVWRDTLGQTSTELDQQPADANHDFVVDEADYEIWGSHFGQPYSFAPDAGTGPYGAVYTAPGAEAGAAASGPIAQSSVPEPATLAMLMFGALGVFGVGVRRPR